MRKLRASISIALEYVTLWNKFKSHCDLQGVTYSAKIMELIDNYLREQDNG